MDLNTVTEVRKPTHPDDVQVWQDGYSWLAGGTWLFSEPQVHLTTLIDIEAFQWPSLTVTSEGLEIAASCKVADLDRFPVPPEWQAGPLLSQCCRAFLASLIVNHVNGEGMRSYRQVGVVKNHRKTGLRGIRISGISISYIHSSAT